MNTLFRIPFLLLLLAALPAGATAQVRGATERIGSLLRVLRLSGADTLRPATDYTENFTRQGRPLHVVTNRWGEVAHVGYYLFPAGLRASQPSPVYDFLERYLLELDLPSQLPRQMRLSLDKVTVKGNPAAAAAFDGTESFGLSSELMRNYSVRWSREGRELLSLNFPMDCQLLTGCNAIELEKNLARDLRRTEPLPPCATVAPRGELTASGATVICHGRTYLNELIRSDLYLRKSAGSYFLIEDAARPLQTIPNLMLAGPAGRDYRMDLSLDKYGYDAETFTVSLGQWQAFCREQGCELYFGVKTLSGGVLTGTLFAVNERMGYNHVLSVEFPVSLLQGGEGSIRARLLAYIPLHNVSEKYFKFNIK